MIDTTVETTEAVEGRVVHFAERPITFEMFLELTDEEDNVELVDGVMVEKMAVQLYHERLFVWLLFILHGYVKKRNLGIILGSRTAVEISRFGGRLPDLLFVRRERMDIVQEKAIYGAPDLIIEIVSPGDRPFQIIGLETDYRSLGVAEIVFIDPQKRRVRALGKRDSDYEETALTEGTLSFESVEGFSLQVEWLFQDPRPDELDTLTALLSQIGRE